MKLHHQMMTILLMQISKKKTNIQKILVLVLGFMCLLSACSAKSSQVDDSNDNSVVEFELNEQLLSQRVKCIEKCDVYQLSDQKHHLIGDISKGQSFYLSDLNSFGLLNINDSDLYINGSQFEMDNSNYQFVNNLLSLNQIEIDDEFVMFNEYKNYSINLKGKFTFDTYVEDENSLYVSIQNQRFKIDKKNLNYDYIKDYENIGASKIPVLMYHFFYDEKVDSGEKNNNFIEVNDFNAQLDYLNENNYVSLTMAEVNYFMDDSAKVDELSYAMTIDDGDKSVYEYAYPIIKQHDINATLFIIGGWMGEVLPYSFIEMREDGLELQSHSFLMHQGGSDGKGLLLSTTFDEGVNDTQMSFDYIDGGSVYCYPFGHYNENALNILKEVNVDMAFTTKHGKISADMDKLLLPRIRVSGNNNLQQFISSIN